MSTEELKNWLRYDEETGKIFWLKRASKRVLEGAEAGGLTKRGYVNIGVRGRMFKAHRIAFLLKTGSFPSGHVDHINGNHSDNRWSNLRDVSEKENQQNRPCHRAGTLWGTTAIAGGKYFQARVYGKYLGNFGTMAHAHMVAVEHAKRTGFPLLKEGTNGH